ncbi:MAG TPA: sensor domain-containing diguanylate cyclase [bacterium]|nr:sensor domain-containing diguanylate cyclase [bacterium]
MGTSSAAWRRRLRRFWRQGLDTPFVVTYSIVVLTGVALFTLQVAALFDAIGRAEQQLGTVLLALLLLLVLTLQARAHDRVRRAHARAHGRELHLRRACDELLTDNRLRHARIEELSIIRELGLAINSILDFNRLLATSSQLIADTVEAGSYVLLLRQRDGSFACPLFFRRGETQPGDDPLATRLRTRHLAAGLKQTGAQLADDPDCGRLVIIPLADTEQQLGLLLLFDPKRLPFGTDQLALLSQLGKHLALALKNALLYDMAITDGLTGLYVHRHFQHRLQQELTTAQRYDRALAIIFSDIDHFKKFNDTYGHQIGDVVLKQVAATIRSCLRAADSAYRYGGEEMAVILPETGLAPAAAVAERIRQAIAALRIPTEQGEVQVTTSFGVAVWHEALADKDALIRAADEALYAAKDAGRNRVMLAGHQSPTPVEPPAATTVPATTPPADRHRPRIIRPGRH